MLICPNSMEKRILSNSVEITALPKMLVKLKKSDIIKQPNSAASSC